MPGIQSKQGNSPSISGNIELQGTLQRDLVLSGTRWIEVIGHHAPELVDNGDLTEGNFRVVTTFGRARKVALKRRHGGRKHSR